MSRYLLSRKAIDENIIAWEKLHNKNEHTESLPSFIARKQVVYLLQILLDKGWDEQKAKEELAKIVGNAPSVKI